MTDTPSALSGITVIDLSDGLAAALASMFLADNGARVIRVVSDSADASRTPDIFAIYDRGKEVILLDVEKDSRRFNEMLASADVLLDDSPPSASARGLPDPRFDQRPQFPDRTLLHHGIRSRRTKSR